MTFRWDSQMGRGIHSSYVKEVVTAQRKHLLVKKRDAEISFYYMGQFDIIGMQEAEKENNKGKKEAISKEIGAAIQVEVLADASLQEHQCMIETDSGVFECGIDVQLDNLLGTLKSLSL